MSQDTCSSNGENEKPTQIDKSIMLKFENIIPEYNVDINDSDRLLQFLCLTGRLKTLPRRGWLLHDREVVNPEPIASHMYRMAIMAMLLFEDNDEQLLSSDTSASNKPKKKLNIEKMIQMSLVHDMAECIVGDITPFDSIDSNHKHFLELDTMKKLANLLPDKASKRLLELYNEYESHQTPEASLVKQLDRLDFCLQAFQYEKQEYYNSLSNKKIFIPELESIIKNHIKHPLLSEMGERLIAERDRFWKQVKIGNNIFQQNHSNNINDADNNKSQ